MNNDDLIARKFHETYERLAPSFGYATRTETREFDPESPNGKLMIAVCNKVVGDALAEQKESHASFCSQVRDKMQVVKQRVSDVEQEFNLALSRIAKLEHGLKAEMALYQDLLKEYDELEPDAKRYRFLRDSHTVEMTGQGGDWTYINIRLEREAEESVPLGPGMSAPVFLSFDRAVDAAMAEKKS